MIAVKKLLDARKDFRDAGIDDYLFTISDSQREQVKSIVLEIYIDIQEYCRRNGIVPFLVGGSALGAVRHQGFIPWDDDLDVGMIRKQYDKFVLGFRREYRDKYVINCAGKSKNAKTRFTKVMKKGTICRELVGPSEDYLNGIFVDIFPIDNVPNNRIIRALKGCYCNALEFISSQVFYKEFENKEILTVLRNTGRVNYYVRRTVGNIFRFKKSSEWFAKIDTIERWKDEKSLYCSIIPGRKHYFGEIIRRDIIFPERYVKFDNIVAPVFCDVEAYLSNLYGDYMKIPPEDKRERHMVRELKF